MLNQIFGTLEAGSRVIIFTSTKRMCDQLGMQLMRMIGVGVIHGDKDQREREQVRARVRVRVSVRVRVRVSQG